MLRPTLRYHASCDERGTGWAKRRTLLEQVVVSGRSGARGHREDGQLSPDDVRGDMALVVWSINAWISLVSQRAYTVGREAEWASSSGEGRWK